MVSLGAVGNRRLWAVWNQSMAARHRKRTAAASAISLALHGLFLAAMVLGLRAIPPPPEAPPIQVQLIAPFVQDRPRPALTPSPAPSRAAPRPVLAPRPAPTPPTPLAPVPVAPSPIPPAPPAATPGLGGPKALLPSLTGRLGCDDPITFHLNKEQMAVCEQRLAEEAKAAKPLALDIATARMAELDRNRRCHDEYTRGSIPSSSSQDDSTGRFNSGLGYNPRLRDCKPSDR
jgi:hypothetical protein